jgi:hypothetical protein
MSWVKPIFFTPIALFTFLGSIPLPPLLMPLYRHIRTWLVLLSTSANVIKSTRSKKEVKIGSLAMNKIDLIRTSWSQVQNLIRLGTVALPMTIKGGNAVTVT